MSTIVTCPCGAKVRVPTPINGRAFRCPSCKEAFALTSDGFALHARLLSPKEQGAACPICQTRIAPEDPVIVCPDCEQLHHRECWIEVAGCGSYGCRQAPVVEKAAPEGPVTSAWGDTKKCPACGAEIKSIALKCRFCRTNFGTVNPLTARELRERADLDEASQLMKITVVGLFIASLFGCFAPLVVIIGLCALGPRWRLLKKLGPIYVVLAYSALGLSLLYSGIMLIVMIL